MKDLSRFWSSIWKSRIPSADRRIKRLLVVDHDPVRHLRFRLLVTLLAVGATVSSFYLGMSTASRKIDILSTELQDTKADNGEQFDELDGLRRKVAILERGASINQQAAEEVRLDLVRMREEKSVMSRDLRFFRGIMDPTRAEDGVSIQRFELQPTSDTRRFQWKFVVVQNAKQHQLQKGNLKVRIDGYKGEARASYDLGQLSRQMKDKGQDLGFRYFQGIPGDGVWGTLELPENFEPDAIEVSIQLTSPSRKVATKSFEWLIEESE